MANQELSELEQYTTSYFDVSGPFPRDIAFNWLDQFSMQENIIEHCTNAISNSQNPFTLLFCCKCLLKLLTEHWSSTPEDKRTGLATFLHQYLQNSGPLIIDVAYSQDFLERSKPGQTPPLIQAIQSICELYARIQKLGWVANGESMNSDLYGQFFRGQLNLSLVGLKLLNEILRQVCFDHDKAFTATENRRVFLQQHQILTEALNLALMCWSFDFIGTSPSSSNDDNASVHIPASWQPLFEDTMTHVIFFELFDKLSDFPNEQKTCLEILCQFAAVRRSIYSNDDSKLRFISSMLDHLTTIMKSSICTSNQNITHQLCRLIFKLKATYTNQDLESVPIFSSFIVEVSRLTFTAFKNWESSANILYYLLSFWARMVQTSARGSSTFSRTSNIIRLFPDNPIHILLPVTEREDPNPAHLDVTWESLITDVVKQYVETKLVVSQKLVDDLLNEDPFNKEDLLTQQMNSIALLVRFSYSSLCPYLVDLLQPRLERYTTLVQLAQADRSEDTISSLALVETELAWIVYVVGGTISVKRNSSHRPDLDTFDGEISGHAMRLLRINQMMPPITTATKRLVMAELYFINNFSKTFIIESVSFCTVVNERITHIAMISSAQHILSAFVDLSFNLLRNWPSDTDMLDACLSFLGEVERGYNGAKLIQNVESMKDVLQNHTVERFEFLREPSNLHIQFYEFLGNLLFTEHKFDLFQPFFTPFTINLRFLSQKSHQELTSPEFEAPLISLFLDLRGISQSCTAVSYFGQLFDELKPYFDTFVRIVVAWEMNSKVVCAFLKFWGELSLNRSLRHSHNLNAANAVHLFRTTAEIVEKISPSHIYETLPAFTTPDNLYKNFYKPVKCLLVLLSNSIDGSYVPFGVCNYYDDNSLERSVETAFRMINSVPRRHLEIFPKLADTTLTFLNAVFHSEIQTALTVEKTILLGIIEKVVDSLSSLNPNQISKALEIFNSIFTYVYSHEGRPDHAVSNFYEVETIYPELFATILLRIFTIALKEEELQTQAAHPLLAVIKVHPDLYETYLHSMSSSVPEDQREVFVYQFGTQLLEDIPESLNHRSRDRFCVNFAQLRKDWLRLFT
ncbi:putative Ran-binding protein [Blattamonas nauphoetae]|uniref:Ran-binding protein n=1 Tax=Blattamonas nauphoetae TaxID=2049346 RepID=A0ABQ9YFB8_9EUKA|nr:putative Ran-binding protein [Blattamonas nauphoetae]